MPSIPRRPMRSGGPLRGRSRVALAFAWGVTFCLAAGLGIRFLAHAGEPPGDGGASRPFSAAPDPDFPAKPPPRPGDWLYAHPEEHQSVEAYKDECVVRKRPDRQTIVLQPMGGLLETHKDTLESVREYAAIYWESPVEVAEPIPMPAETYAAKRRQYDADRILVDLANRVPGKAIAYFGFCREDLYSEGLNYVFGIASLRQRAGVYSLARYGTKGETDGGGEPVFLKRTLKVATHELAHVYGMGHCIRFQCNVNGANSVPEMDREPMHLCPECLEKARWNIGFDVKDRYGKLAAFYDKAGLKKDAAFARRQAEKAARAAGPAPR